MATKETTSPGPWLYQHDDGRNLVADPSSRTIANDPKWHRVGLVEVETSDTLPTEPTTLEAQQALRFLETFEKWSLPAGTRAYLVCIDIEGKRRLKPVSDESSIVNLQANLLDHLNDMPLPEPVLRGLLAFCECRLKGMKLDPRSVETQQAVILTERCADLSKLIERMLQAAYERADDDIDDPDYDLHGALHLVRQLGYQVDRVSELLGEDWQYGRADDWMLPRAYTELLNKTGLGAKHV